MNDTPKWSPWPKPDDPDNSETANCIVDHEDDIDWDNIVAVTDEDDKLAFNSADYATEEEAMIALRAFIHEIFEEVERDAACRRRIQVRRVLSASEPLGTVAKRTYSKE